MKKMSIGTKMTISFTLVIVLFIIISIVTLINTKRLGEDSNQVNHTHEVLEKLEMVLGDLKDAETGQRGFIITGLVNYLEQYESALIAIRKDISDLQQLTIDNDIQQQQIDKLNVLITNKLDELETTINIRRTSFEAAKKIVISDDAKKIMDDIRSIIIEMKNHEIRLLKKRETLSKVNTNNANNVTIWITIGAFVIVIILILYFTRIIAFPIRKLSLIAKQIAVGDLTGEVSKTDRKDEIGVLAESFNLMQQYMREKATQANHIAKGNLIMEVKPLSINDTMGVAFALMLDNLRSHQRDQDRSIKIIEQKEKYLQTVFNGAVDAIITINEEGIVEEFNLAAERIFQYKAKEIIGQNVKMITNIHDRKHHDQYLRNFKETGKATIIGTGREVVGVKKDGTNLILRLAVNEVYIGNKRKFVGMLLDLSESKRRTEELEKSKSAALSIMQDAHSQRKRAENALKELEVSNQELKKLNHAIEQSMATVVITDKTGKIEYVNPAFTKASGYTFEEAIGNKPGILKSGKHDDAFYKNLWDTILFGKTWKGDFINKKKSGEEFWESASISPVIDNDGEITHFVAVKEDITHRKIYLQELEARANKLTRHSKLLQELTQEKDFTEGDISQAFKSITKVATTGLGCSRSGIWLYKPNNKAIECEILYEADTKSYSSGLILLKEDFPDYFKALLTNNIITVDNARNDSRTNEFTDSYLIPLGIYSMLDVPIWSRGKVVGVICNEHTKKIRKWGSDEELFARSLADLISLAIETNERKKVQEDAEKATKAKSTFLTNMSHEIRTPMNAILGFSEILSKRIEDESQIQYLKSIQSSGKTLLDLINNILDLSKIESGKLDFSYEPSNIKILVQDIVGIFKVKIDEKDLNLNVIISEDLPSTLYIEELRIKQILINLINNSIKFTEKGYIEIEATCANKTNDHIDLILKIEDTGVGIPGKYHKKIFQAFDQMDNQDSKKYEGTGLGLAITQQLVKLMNGRIELESEVGKGSIFTIILEKVKISRDEILIEEKNDFDPDSILFEESTVLIVDDIKTNRDVLKGYLSDYKINIIEAANGLETINNIEKYKPDLVFLDLRMPVMDGYEANEIIKKNPEWSQIPIVAITASAFDKDEKKVIAMGFSGYVRKPASLVDILTILIKFLKHTIVVKDEEVINESTVETIDRPEEVLSEIEKKVMPVWEEIIKIRSKKNVFFFAELLMEIGHNYKATSLIRYGNELLSASKLFNIDKEKRLIQQFPDFVKNLNSSYNGK
ncbi:MAG: PAS domain S-box protein [Bacteroidota bacterium]